MEKIIMKKLENLEMLAQLREKLKADAVFMEALVFKDEQTEREYFTGYPNGTLFDWDQYFEGIIELYLGWDSTHLKTAITLFLDHQHPNGFIARSVPSNPYHDKEHVKPFLAQSALLVAEYHDETDYLLENDYLLRIKKYLDYWLIDMDSDGDGLSEWMSAAHTGMDDQHERAGWWENRISAGVDLNSYLVRECRAFAKLSKLFGKAGDAVAYRAKADKLAEKIRELCWNEEDGIFYDSLVQLPEGGQRPEVGVFMWAAPQPPVNELSQLTVKHIGAFATLWAGVATPEQAERMINDYLFNTNEFWSNYPVAVMARSEKWYSEQKLPMDIGCNWRANTWIPSNYFVYHGLHNYGYGQLASLVANATARLMDKSGVHEYYNSETGDGVGIHPFGGWSVLGHFFLYEETCEHDITALD
jgi:putative isomerase